MIDQIYWTEKAVQSFEIVIDYLEENASSKAKVNFIFQIEELIIKLKKYPGIGRKSKKYPTVRQYKIDKYRKLYYRAIGDTLVIILIFDSRQDPHKNKYS